MSMLQRNRTQLRAAGARLISVPGLRRSICPHASSNEKGVPNVVTTEAVREAVPSAPVNQAAHNYAGTAVNHTAETSAMQNLHEDLDHVVDTLLRGDEASLRAVIERCFTEDAEFDHPLLVVKGRDKIFQVYRYWSSVINKDLRFEVNWRVVSEGGNHVVLHVSEWITPHLYPSALLPSPMVFVVINFTLVDTPRGKVISRQEDHLMLLEALVYQLPFLGPLYKNGWRRMSGDNIVNMTSWLNKRFGKTQDNSRPGRITQFKLGKKD